MATEPRTDAAEGGALVGVFGDPPAGGGGQASPSAVSDTGGAATADAGTGGQQKYGVLTAADRDALRATLAAAHPDAVAGMIGGETVGEMIASLASAKEAYAAVIRNTQAATPVSAGGGGRPVAVDVSKLTPLQKIAVGLKGEGTSAGLTGRQ